MKDILATARLRQTSKPIKVFLFNLVSGKLPEANGAISLDKDFLLKHKESFKKWLLENVSFPAKGPIPYTDFVSPLNGTWTNEMDDALVLLAALEVLGFGKVVGNGPREEMLKSSGFNIFPQFLFNDKIEE